MHRGKRHNRVVQRGSPLQPHRSSDLKEFTMKKLIALAAACLLLAACSPKAPDPAGSVSGSNGASSSVSSGSQSESQEGEITADDLFASLPAPFVFASGVGAWDTQVTIAPDGSFSGVYHDADMGGTGEGYPNGTEYICEFTGQFSQPTQVDDHTWSVQLESLSYDGVPETEEIRDGIRYVCSTPYGIEGGEEFLIYLPGAPVADLPEGFCNWVGTQLVDANNDRATELPFFGLYNVTTQEGFSAYPDDGEAAG